MGGKGEMLDCGTYTEVSTRQLMDMGHGHESEEEKIGTAPGPDDANQAGDKAELGEYQVQLETRMTDLRRQTGDWRSYVLYIQSLGWLNFSIFVFGAVTYAVFTAFFQVWVTWWSEDTAGSHPLGYWLGLYAVWGVLMMAALLVTPM